MSFRYCRLGLHWFPVATAVLMPSTFFISYIMAVVQGHVEPGFPYISDTGAIPPESCVFGQLLNIGSVLAGICVYIQYRFVEEFAGIDFSRAVKCWNKINLFIGLFGALGISIVGNFQETNVLIVHLIGALLAFGFSALYGIILTVLSFRLYPNLGTKFVCYLRLLASIWVCIFFISTFTAAHFAKKEFHGPNPRKWYPQDGGFSAHVVSTASEWAMAIGILIFFLTMIPDFSKISMERPVILYTTGHEIMI